MNLKIIYAILFVLILSSCATQIPDVFICADIDQSTGYCAKTISNEEKEITGPEWQSFKSDSLKISVDDWAQIKSYILKQCKKNKQCDLPQLESKINQFELNLGQH